MKLVCPECGAHGSLAAFASDVDARAVSAALAKLPAEVATPLLVYIGLFRPAKRLLTWPRARRLVDDLVELMQSPAIHRRGRDWQVTPAMWRQALTQMVDQRTRLTLPLKSHGYLLEIVAGLADKSEAKTEDRHEAELRQGFKAGHQASARNSRELQIEAAISTENAARRRLKLELLTAAEIPAFLKKEGLA